MVERRSSKTAIGAAVLRAAHQLIDEEPKILDDPVILRLLEAPVLEQLRSNPGRFQAPQSKGLRSHIVLRSRYTEDRLAEAVRDGIGQYLILGAGLDTFPYRQPDWARYLHIFEVDHGASQQFKRERLALAEITVPPNVEFIPLDFETVNLHDGLRQSNFALENPSFISWLGVMAYLSMEAIEAVFRFVASLPPTSEIVFTFATTTENGRKNSNSTAARAAAHGEPWLTRIDPDTLVRKLQKLGFSKISFLTPADAAACYFRDRRDGLPAPREVRIGSARV